MACIVTQIYLSYSQICIFISSLQNPFNDWSHRNFTQGFSWRPGSASFRSLVEEGEHKINFFINEPIPTISENYVRVFQVPFKTPDGNIEIASISDTKSIEIPAGTYSLRVEFLKIVEGFCPEINIRLNEGESEFLILKGDEEILIEGDLDLMANPAT